MKLFRFRHSCYALKIQTLLELASVTFELVDVPYGDRSVLLAVTNGYIQVPVLVMDDSRVLVDSRVISETLVNEDPRCKALVPSPHQGPIWAYADWTDTTLEDVMFKLASPSVRAKFSTANERAFYTYIKERKFGAGCVDDWMMGAASLAKRAGALLEPTARTLEKSPFLFGDRPTLADAALFGQIAMLAGADLKLLAGLPASILTWFRRVQEAGASDPTEAPPTIHPQARSARMP